MAEPSGKKILIPHSRPYLGEEEVKSAGEVIRSGHIAQGERVERFEKEFCRGLGLGRGAALSSGTAALYLSLSAMGVKPDDEVIIPSYVCTAVLHAVRRCGASPVLADVDPRTGNMDPSDAERRVSKRTRAMIVPHMFGLPADMDRLLELDIPVIEDCAQAVGSTWRGKPVGALGVASAYSFYATKVMTTGEGGMAVSGSRQLVDKIIDIRDYDKKEQDLHRFNFKMTDIQAGLGLVQISRLEFFIKRRREIAGIYTSAFAPLGLVLPPVDAGHIYFRYIIGLSGADDPEKWIQELKNKGIRCERPVFKPLHRYLGITGYPGTEKMYKRFISIPVYPALGQDQIDCVVQAVIEMRQKGKRI